MILITGGAYQGKCLFAKQLISDNKMFSGIENDMSENVSNIIICSTELGCGIVPIKEFDRNWREVTGRLCCMLAKEAKVVYRVNCGIGMQIK